MRALLKDLAEHVPPERRPALERYLKRVDSGIRSTFEETEDRKDALEEDRQGLGLSRERQGTSAPAIRRSTSSTRASS